MGIKRIKGMIFTFILTILLFFPVVAASGGKVLSFGRISIYMPELTVEVRGTGYNTNDMTAILGTETLIISSAEAFDPLQDSVCTYILLDTSASMAGSFSVVLDNIHSYVGAMKDEDRLVLLTFGETVTTVLYGDESKEEIVSTLSQLECNEKDTMFYDAMIKAHELSNANRSSFSREYVLVFSDGMDDQKGSSTYNEAMKQYSTHSLPVYAICTPNASQEGVDKFGEIARTSGGTLVMLSGDGKEVFQSLMTTINDVTLLTLQAGSNIATGDTKQLSVNVGSSQAEISIPVTRSIPDMEAPEVSKVTFDPDNNTLAIHFTKHVQNADRISAFDITEADGRKLMIQEVKYFEDRQIAYLTLQNGYIGSYTISFNGITDTSMEENKLLKNAYFKLNQDVGVPLEEPNEYPWLLIIVIGSILFLGVMILIVAVVLHKKTVRREEEQPNTPHIQIQNEYEPGKIMDIKHHVKAPSSVRVRISVKTGKALEQKVETSIISSLIVGRSNICDLYIDDHKMSRQHFVIENVNGTLMLMDLGSTNGTMLNGIQVGSRQHLKHGDKIFAGLSDIIIYLPEGGEL